MPKRISSDDYHDFEHLEEQLKVLNKKIKVVEVDFMGKYVGIIYHNKQDKAFKELKKAIKKESREYWKQIF